MGASESSAVIAFISENRKHPVDRHIFSRRAATPAPLVILPARPSPLRAQLTFTAAVLLVGLAGGLLAGQTEPGRRLVDTVGSPVAATVPAPPPALAAAPAPRPIAPVAAALPCPTPAPVAAAPVAPAVVAPAPPPPAPAAVVTTAIPATPAPRERAKRQGTLRIASTPTADIYIDGKKTGLRTPQRIKLKPGKHTVTLVNSKKKIRTRLSVRITDGKTTRVTKKLRRERKR